MIYTIRKKEKKGIFIQFYVVQERYNNDLQWLILKFCIINQMTHNILIWCHHLLLICGISIIINSENTLDTLVDVMISHVSCLNFKIMIN
jgi:hypothetical protein